MGGPDPSGGLSVGQRFEHLEREVREAFGRIDALEDWRSELRGAFTLVKIALGSSIVSGILGVAAVITLVAGGPK